MSVEGGPDIVTDGLVLHLDAANNRSFVSGSTTWFDLSGFGNNAVLTNGPTYTGSNNGAIVFDGSNDYAPLATSASFPLGTSPGTVSAWAWIPAGFDPGGSYRWIFNYGTHSGLQMRALGIAGGKFTFDGYGNRVYSDIDWYPSNGTVWYNVVGTFSASLVSLYVNGRLSGGPSSFAWNTVGGASQIARNSVGSEFWPGRINQVMIYNKALSAKEIRQNYNATKGRYGLF